MLDYYSVLDVSRTATAEEIRKAYYSRARQCHPDVCSDPDAEHAFKLLNEAYQTLSNPQKRRKHDLLLQYGGLIDLSRVTSRDSRSARPRSAAYEAYVRRRKEEIRQERLRIRKYNIILNNLMFWIMAVLMTAGIVYGLIDAIMNYDFRTLVFVFAFLAISVTGLIYMHRHR